MNNTLEHKGFRAKIEYSADDDLLVGRLIGIRDIVTFHAESVAELRKELEASVDFHIEVCKEFGKMRKNVSNMTKNE